MKKINLKGVKAQVMYRTILVMAIGVSIYLTIVIPQIRNRLVSQEVAHLEKETALYSSKVNDSVQVVYGDIISLAQTPPIQGIIRAKDNDGFDEEGNSSYTQWKERLEEIFIAAEEAKGIYHDLRYLDENGDEMVRVNIRNGAAKIVSDEALQNKANRYYFVESVGLPAGSIYVSQLDLNREGDPPEIENPHRPVIRYAYPVYDNDGNNRGIVISTVNAELLFNIIGNDLEDEFIVLDSRGYYLRHPDERKEWGSDSDLGTGENFQKDYPVVWNDVIKNIQGNTEDNNNLFVYNRIDLTRDRSREITLLRLVDLDVLLNSTNSIVSAAILVAIFVALSIVTTIYLIVRRVTTPFDSLAEAVEQIGAGDFSKRIAVTTDDEVGRIAESFNKMAAQLGDIYKGLDAKVKEKTTQLEKTLGSVEEQNKDLAETKSAMLNVVEDSERERLRAEGLATDLKKFQLAVENAGDHIVITDKEGTVLYANEAVEKITGYRREEVIGQKAGSKDLWGGQMDKEFYEKMWQIIKIEKRLFTGEVTNKRKNGKLYTAFATISPILDKNGEVEFFIGIERDITHEKEVDKAKTEFVSLASHQLRTPLSTINWYTELLLSEDSGKVNDEQKKYLQEVYAGSKRMVELVNALLNVSRLDLGTFAVDPEPTDVVTLIKEVVKELEPKVFQQKQELVEKYPEGGLGEINLDPKLFRMTVQNLLSNAIKYTPEQGKIVVSLTKKSTTFELSVSDNGMGIPAASKDKIFTKLFRADNVREKDTTGTGLGLYIIKSVIDYVGGKIWFDSEEGKGTTFYVELPLTGMQKKDGSKPLEEQS